MTIIIGEEINIKELKILTISTNDIDIVTVYFPLVKINGEEIMCRSQCRTKTEARNEGKNYLRELKRIQLKQEEEKRYGEILPVKLITINKSIYGPTFDSARE